jgi:hypothetical protein
MTFRKTVLAVLVAFVIVALIGFALSVADIVWSGDNEPTTGVTFTTDSP